MKGGTISAGQRYLTVLLIMFRDDPEEQEQQLKVVSTNFQKCHQHEGNKAENENGTSISYSNFFLHSNLSGLESKT